MIFRVPENFEGTFVLNTLKKALWAGMSVSIYGDDVYAPDVKIAIKKGVLVPVDEEYDKEKADLSHEAMVINKTDRVLVLGDIVLKPWASRLIEKKIIKSASIQSAEKNGFIHIISDETSFIKKSKKKTKKVVVGKAKKTSTKKTKKTKGVKVITVTKETSDKEKYTPPKTGEDIEVTPKAWDFRAKEMKDAQPVPKTPDMIKVDKEEGEEVEFVDRKASKPSKKKKKAKKKRAKKKIKKTTKKKKVKKTNKKKEMTTKKRKVKTIEPVGEVKPTKTVVDAIVELDSRGRPIEKASDTLQHMIDSLEVSPEVGFVDDEQAQDRLRKRKDME